MASGSRRNDGPRVSGGFEQGAAQQELESPRWLRRSGRCRHRPRKELFCAVSSRVRLLPTAAALEKVQHEVEVVRDEREVGLRLSWRASWRWARARRVSGAWNGQPGS